MRLTVLGCGDAFGSGGRAQACFMAEAEGFACLIDCGATSTMAMRRWGVDPDRIDAVILSHLHGDHFGGLVFLLLEARRTRARPLVIAGPAGTEARLAAALAALYPGSSVASESYSLSFVELHAGETVQVGAARVSAYPAAHEAGAPCHSLRVRIGGRTLGYSGDTAWTEALGDVGRGADLFLCEASHWESDAGGHMAYSILREKLPGIGARRAMVTHMGPEVLARRAEIEADGLAIVADDGLVLEL